MQNEECKYEQIQEYFMSHTKLGYSIFVQSPLSQPIVHRNKDYYEQFAAENHVDLKNYTTEQGIKDIRQHRTMPPINSHNQVKRIKLCNGHIASVNLLAGALYQAVRDFLSAR